MGTLEDLRDEISRLHREGREPTTLREFIAMVRGLFTLSAQWRDAGFASYVEDTKRIAELEKAIDDLSIEADKILEENLTLLAERMSRDDSKVITTLEDEVSALKAKVAESFSIHQEAMRIARQFQAQRDAAVAQLAAAEPDAMMTRVRRGEQ